MSHWFLVTKVSVVGIIRDKVLRAVFLSGLFFLLLAPFFSMLSMRQVQQLTVTVALSWTSLTLLVMALVLGSSSIWRDIERRWLYAVLGMPVSRTTYVLARISAIFVCLLSAGLFLGGMGAVLISLGGGKLSAALHFTWSNYCCAVLFDVAKYMLLATIAALFSTLGTSFFLPMFATLGVFFAGSASQGAIEYLTTTTPPVSPATLSLAKCLYYLLPNFSVFDFSTQAVYGLAIPASQMLWGGLYFAIYWGIIACCAVLCFRSRELK